MLTLALQHILNCASILLLHLHFLLNLSELFLSNPLAAVVLLEEAEAGHLQLASAELMNLHSPVTGIVQQ